MSISPSLHIESPIRIAQERIVVDLKNIRPHEAKEISEWSWRKMKNEKWVVYLDCITKRLQKRKVSS